LGALAFEAVRKTSHFILFENFPNNRISPTHLKVTHFYLIGDESDGGEGEEDEVMKSGGYEDEDHSMMDSEGGDKDEEDDPDTENGGGRKKKKSKKHKSRSDDKKSKKKKKKKRADSGEGSEAEDETPVEDQASSKRKTKSKAVAAPASSADSGMPSVEEVCSTFSLQDVDIDYEDPEFQNLNSYKLFQQHVRPIIQKENPKVLLILFLSIS